MGFVGGEGAVGDGDVSFQSVGDVGVVGDENAGEFWPHLRGFALEDSGPT